MNASLWFLDISLTLFLGLSWVPLTTWCSNSGQSVIYTHLFGVTSAFLTLKHKFPFSNYLPHTLLLGNEKDFMFSDQAAPLFQRRKGRG